MPLHEAGVGQVQEGTDRRGQPKEGRDPPKIILCDAGLLLTK